MRRRRAAQTRSPRGVGPRRGSPAARVTAARDAPWPGSRSGLARAEDAQAAKSGKRVNKQRWRREGLGGKEARPGRQERPDRRIGQTEPADRPGPAGRRRGPRPDRGCPRPRCPPPTRTPGAAGPRTAGYRQGLEKGAAPPPAAGSCSPSSCHDKPRRRRRPGHQDRSRRGPASGRDPRADPGLARGQRLRLRRELRGPGEHLMLLVAGHREAARPAAARRRRPRAAPGRLGEMAAGAGHPGLGRSCPSAAPPRFEPAFAQLFARFGGLRQPQRPRRRRAEGSSYLGPCTTSPRLPQPPAPATCPALTRHNRKPSSRLCRPSRRPSGTLAFARKTPPTCQGPTRAPAPLKSAPNHQGPSGNSQGPHSQPALRTAPPGNKTPGPQPIGAYRLSILPG